MKNIEQGIMIVALVDLRTKYNSQMCKIENKKMEVASSRELPVLPAFPAKKYNRLLLFLTITAHSSKKTPVLERTGGDAHKK